MVLLKRTQLTKAIWQFTRVKGNVCAVLLGTKSVIQTQRRYRRQYGEQGPGRQSINRWLEQFQETDKVWSALSRHEVTGPFLFKRRQWTVKISSIYFRCLQSRKWHTFKSNVFFQQDVAWEWVSLWIKLFQTSGLGGTERSPGPLAPPIYANPIGMFLLGLCKGPRMPSKSW